MQIKGFTYWYLWYDSLAKFYKYGDHFVHPMIDKDGNFVREKTREEVEKEVITYLQSPAYLGRGSTARVKGQEIVRMMDVSDYAKKNNAFGTNRQVDALIEENTILKFHRLEDKDTVNPDTITKDEILRVVNEEVFGVRNLNVYPMYDKQVDAHDKAIAYYSNSGTDFLLDCVMRFGKCFTSYQIAKSLGAKRILVITGRPKVKLGWKNDLDHIDFPNWEFIDSTIATNVKFSDPNDLFVSETPADVEVIFASFQGSDRDKYKSRLHIVEQQDIDLVIIDELHAYLSPDVLEFIYKLKTPRRHWVSGTPFVAYESGMFMGDEDTYRFTLMDLQRERVNGHPRFKDFPAVQFWVAKYPDWSNSPNAAILNNEQGLNMPLLLSNNNGVTNYPTEVQSLLDSIQGNTLRKDSVIGIGPRETQGLTKPVEANHIWFSVPPGVDDSKKFGVASATTLCNEIPKHPFLNKYAPLAVRGDKSEDDVNHHMTQNPNGSAIISCRSLTVGTKFEPLDMVVFLRETISAADFWQTCGRGWNPCVGKEVINIVVFSAELMVNMADAIVDTESGSKGHQALLEEFFTLMPTHLIGGPSIERLDANKAYKILDKTGSPEKSFKNRAIFVPDIEDRIANDLTFAAGFPEIDKEDGDKHVDLHKSGGPKGKNKSHQKGPQPPANPDVVKECLSRMREFMRLTVSIQASCIVHEDYHVQTLDDLKDAPTKPIDSVFGPGTKELFDGLLERGWINTSVYDKTISKSYNVHIKDEK